MFGQGFAYLQILSAIFIKVLQVLQNLVEMLNVLQTFGEFIYFENGTIFLKVDNCQY